MGDIFKYGILNPVKDSKMPFFDEKKGIFYITNITINYRYYIEAIAHQENGDVDYYILLGKTKFNVNCRLCNTDNYSRVQIKVRGEFKQFILNESKERGNFNVEYIESIEDYDVFKVT